MFQKLFCAFQNKKKLILDFDKILGLDLDKREEVNKIPENIQKLVDERNRVRQDKDFAKSDELRQEIEKLGFEVKDTPEGTVVNALS